MLLNFSHNTPYYNSSNKHITAYIIKEFFKNFIMIFLVAMAITLLLDSIEILRISGSYTINVLNIFKIAIFKNYSTMQKILPFIFLITSLKTYITLNKYFEIIASYNVGISDIQLITPAIIVLVIFTIIHIFVLMPLSSYCMLRYHLSETEKTKNNISINYIQPSQNSIWLKQINYNNYNNENYNDKNNKESNKEGNFNIIHALQINQNKKELLDVEIFTLDENGRFIEKIITDKLINIPNNIKNDKNNVKSNNKNNSHITMSNTWITGNDVKILDSNNTINTSAKSIVFHFNSSFDDIVNGMIPPEMVSILKLHNFINIVGKLGFSISKYEIYFWKIILSPLLYIVMIIIGYMFNKSLPRLNNINYVYFKAILFAFAIYFGNEILTIVILNKGLGIFMEVLIPYALSLVITTYVFIHVRSI